MVSLEQHVHPLNNEAIGVVLELDDPLQPQNIGPELMHGLLHPGENFLGNERCLRCQ